jgi:hypothetical protein
MKQLCREIFITKNVSRYCTAIIMAFNINRAKKALEYRDSVHLGSPMRLGHDPDDQVYHYNPTNQQDRNSNVMAKSPDDTEDSAYNGFCSMTLHDDFLSLSGSLTCVACADWIDCVNAVPPNSMHCARLVPVPRDLITCWAPTMLVHT